MSLFETRFGGNATGLPGPAPLPPLTSALSRRAALFGAVTVAGASVASLPAKAGAGTLSANDARLVALSDEYEALEAAVEATHSTDLGYEDLIDRYLPLEEGMGDTSADTIVGVLAKARACQNGTLRDCASQDVSLSLADDLWRLFGAGALS